MTQDDYVRKLDELDTLLNDPDVPMDPARVWSLLADLSERDTGCQVPRRSGMSAARGESDAGARGLISDGLSADR